LAGTFCCDFSVDLPAICIGVGGFFGVGKSLLDFDVFDIVFVFRFFRRTRSVRAIQWDVFIGIGTANSPTSISTSATTFEIGIWYFWGATMPHSLVNVSQDDFVVSRPLFKRAKSTQQHLNLSTQNPQSTKPFPLKHFSRRLASLSLLIISAQTIKLLLSHYPMANYACVEL